MGFESKVCDQLRQKLFAEVWLWMMGISYYLGIAVKSSNFIPERILVLCYLCPFALGYIVCNLCMKSQITRAMIRISIPLATSLLRFTFYSLGLPSISVLDGYFLSALQVGLMIDCWMYEGLLLPLRTVRTLPSEKNSTPVKKLPSERIVNPNKQDITLQVLEEYLLE